MRKAYHMKVRKIAKEDKKKVKINKLGGVPTHLPASYPCYPTGNQEAFLMQLYYDNKMFPSIEGILCWQIYQHRTGGQIEDIIAIPIDANINSSNAGTPVDDMEEYVIEFEEKEEPDIWDIDNLELYCSKIGGAIPERYLNSENTYIGTIFEDLCNLNLGVEAIELYLDKNGIMKYDIY